MIFSFTDIQDLTRKIELIYLKITHAKTMANSLVMSQTKNKGQIRRTFRVAFERLSPHSLA